MPDFLNGLFFSEILADNAGGGALNVNGQGGANKQDEFIEIQNKSGATIDLNGYQIWSDRNGLLHSFGPGDTIGAGDTATVVGTYTSPPAGFYGANGNNNSASANGGFLEDGEGNKFDTIYLVAPDGNYIQLSYGASPQDPGALPPGFPTGGTLQGSGETLGTGAPNATSIIRDADGNLVEGTPTPGTPGFICFCAGTLIATSLGDVPVEALTPGMSVLTRDSGFVPLRAIRSASIGRQILRWYPDARPINVPAGVLGNTQPLHMSPAHRVLIRSPLAEIYFGEAEVLVSARQMVGHGRVAVDQTDGPVTYTHLLFDDHEIIRANGCWSESLFLGDVAHAAIREVEGWQVQTGFSLDTCAHRQTARMTLKGFEADQLLQSLDLVSPLSDKAA